MLLQGEPRNSGIERRLLKANYDLKFSHEPKAQKLTQFS